MDGIYYNIIPDGVEVTSRGNYEGDIIIPSTVSYRGVEYAVVSIGDKAFYWGTSLTSVTFPESLTSIGHMAFYKCSSLTSVTLPEGLTSIGSGAFLYCSSLTSVTIPKSVTTIGEEAFSECCILTSVTIPESITSIGKRVFYDCWALTSVTLPEGLTSIGDLAFCFCSSLTSVTFPDSLTSIGSGAFLPCSSLTSVTIPESVTTIGDSAFANCSSLTSIDVSPANPFFSSIDGILYNAEVSEILQVPRAIISVTIPNSVTSIGDYAFQNCFSLASVTFPDGLTSISDWAFSSCSALTSVTFPDALTSIGDGAFWGCTSLTSVTLPEGLKSIGNYAFESCFYLTSVTLPESVTSIGDTAFYGCRVLSTVYNYSKTPQTIGSRCFEGVPSSMVIYVPKGCRETYENAEVWKNFTIKEMDIPDDPDNPIDGEYINLTVSSPNQGIISYDYPAKHDVRFSVTAPTGWEVEYVLLNNNEILPDEKGKYATGELTEDSVIDIIYTQILTGNDYVEMQELKVYSVGPVLHIDGYNGMDNVVVYSEDGKLLFNGFAREIPLQVKNQTIILAVGDKTYKLFVR